MLSGHALAHIIVPTNSHVAHALLEQVRQAFTAVDAGKESGNTLVVADYGQLELRILAHITNCKCVRLCCMPTSRAAHPCPQHQLRVRALLLHASMLVFL